ncbi:hypothetical protein [Tautonia marina]|uniref:hypothetical protein n=1 Tax=Tautonia marina TaxID=2653855 RepID=UPI00137544D9|nr:hypothetical protein [Tautonia marina]
MNIFQNETSLVRLEQKRSTPNHPAIEHDLAVWAASDDHRSPRADENADAAP